MPHTMMMMTADLLFVHIHPSTQGVIILCGEGDEAFCSGGDQAVRGEGGYDDGSEAVPRLAVLDLQVGPFMDRCGCRSSFGCMFVNDETLSAGGNPKERR